MTKIDFYCPEHKLAIEIQYLESQGIRVLLFENRELLEIPDYVVGGIRSAVLGQPPRLRQ